MRAAHLWRRWWPAVMAALVLYGLWALTLASPEAPVRADTAPPISSTAATPATTMPTRAVEAGAAPATVVAAAQADLPPGVTAQQWAAIEAELAARPDAASERQRLRDYLGWSDTLRRFREGRTGAAGAPEQQLALAREIEQGLGERLRRAEVSAGEARQIESAILALLVPDETERAGRLRQWAAAELAPPAPVDPRQESFERRQAEIVAAWAARPATERDRASLERELDALRRESLAAGGGTR